MEDVIELYLVLPSEREMRIKVRKDMTVDKIIETIVKGKRVPHPAFGKKYILVRRMGLKAEAFGDKDPLFARSVNSGEKLFVELIDFDPFHLTHPTV